MVHQYKSQIRIYKYKFDTVMKAYEKRFPYCERIPSFCGSEIIREEDDGVEHKIIRKCYFNIEMPFLLKKILKVDMLVFVQTNILNRKLRTLNIEAENETFSSKLSLNEHCVYYVHPDNSEWTCFHQHATMDVKSLFGLENIAERFVLKQYSANIQKGRELLEESIEEVEISDSKLNNEPEEKSPNLTPGRVLSRIEVGDSVTTNTTQNIDALLTSDDDDEEKLYIVDEFVEADLIKNNGRSITSLTTPEKETHLENIDTRSLA